MESRLIAVKVRLFASLREIAGAGQVSIQLRDRSTVGDLRKMIFAIYPAMSGIRYPIAVALNGAIADDATTLTDLDEVSLLPPVSGG